MFSVALGCGYQFVGRFESVLASMLLSNDVFLDVLDFVDLGTCRASDAVAS